MGDRCFQGACLAIVLAALGNQGFGQLFPAERPVDGRIEDLSREITANPADAELLVRRAKLYGEAEQWDAMVRDLDRALEINPRNVTALATRAWAQAILGQADKAFADLDAALALEPDRADVYGLRGNMLLNAGRLEEAVEALTKSVAIAPVAQAYFDRAFCYQSLGKFRAAVADYTEAQRLDPRLVSAVCERGHAHQQLGEFTQALDDLEHCRRSNPDDVQVKLSLAWLLATSPDDDVRSGRRALLLAGEVCDPITCEAVEPLNALAAAYAELGEFAKAESLQERAAALSHFAPEFREACLRRLETIRRREPIREARTPLLIQPRVEQKLPRAVTLDEALAAPADVLALAYLKTQNLLLLCQPAKQGATIHGWLDGQPILVTSGNAAAVEKGLEERQAIYREAIGKRGCRKLAAGYSSACKGGCLDWGVNQEPVLVEQADCDLFLTQGDTRHKAVIVESAIGLVHDANTDITVTGEVTDAGIVFQTPQEGGVTGMAEQRCSWSLRPADVKGPDWAKAFVGRALAHRSYGDYAAMVTDLDRSLELNPTAKVAGLKAYVLATCADERVRDGKRAVAAAELARSLAKGEVDTELVISLAVAHAEAGDFAKAIEYQKQLIELVPDEEKPQQRAHLRMFEARKPFHEQPRF
ncbi:MAG: tetratricopeptide repeat protein [Planctomycetota bacterium]